jgi:prepilin signal peptidase PulO-like enzyme (type II secretory pathway)
VFFIAWKDISERTIPDVWLWPLLLCGLCAHGGDPETAIAAISGYILGFCLMAATAKRNALGYGDVKLLAVAGLWTGIDGLSWGVVCACALGIIWGLAKRQRYIPFAPFLFLGIMVYYLIKALI